MNKQVPPADDGHRMPSPEGTEARSDAFAVSPAIGPLAAIYVPSSPSQAVRPGLLWHAMVRAARLADGWAVRRALTGGAMPDIPADLRYSEDHLWVRGNAGSSLVRVGVTDFAQRSLGDVVDVTPPRAGETVTAGEACGDIESVKSVSDLIAPVSGTARARNESLTRTPELVNADPYGQGWIFEVEIDPLTMSQQLASLLDAGAYRELAGE